MNHICVLNTHCFFCPESNELCIVYTVNLSTAHLGALEVLNIYIHIDLQIAIFSIFLSPKKNAQLTNTYTHSFFS